MKNLRGYLFILGATTLWGISATLAKSMFLHSINTLVLVQMRMTFSCVVLTIILLAFRRDLLRVRWKDLYLFALMGVIGGAGSNFTYYFTIQQTNVATAILLQYMAPLLVLAYAAISREEIVSLPKFAAGLVSIVGCFLLVGGRDFSLLTINHLGLFTGILSAFCWAFANVWLRRLVRLYNVWTCIVYTFFFASVFWLFFNPPWAIFSSRYPSSEWATYFGFALISVLIPHSLYYIGVSHLPASRAIITATSEPIIAIASAFVLIHEVLAPVQFVGAVLVIVAIALLQIPRQESEFDPAGMPLPPAD